MLSMDLRKAFDTVDHPALFDALHQHGVPIEYIELLRLLYKNQVGSVNESRPSSNERCVKQGDALCAILFNCVVDIVFERWKRRLLHEGIYTA
jgi:hypothetical protein